MSPTWLAQLGFGPTSASGLPAWNNLKFILPFFLPSFLPHKYCDVGYTLCEITNTFPSSLTVPKLQSNNLPSDSGLIPWGSQVYEEKYPWDSSSRSGLRFHLPPYGSRSSRPPGFWWNSRHSQFWFLLIPQVSAFTFIQSSMDSFFYANATAWLNIIIIYLPVFHFIKNIEVIQGT